MRDDDDALAMLDAQQRHQRQNSAFAVVVGAHDHGDIFERGGDNSVQTISDSMPIATDGVAPPAHSSAVLRV